MINDKSQKNAIRRPQAPRIGTIQQWGCCLFLAAFLLQGCETAEEAEEKRLGKPDLIQNHGPFTRYHYATGSWLTGSLDRIQYKGEWVQWPGTSRDYGTQFISIRLLKNDPPVYLALSEWSNNHGAIAALLYEKQGKAELEPFAITESWTRPLDYADGFPLGDRLFYFPKYYDRHSGLHRSVLLDERTAKQQFLDCNARPPENTRAPLVSACHVRFVGMSPDARATAWVESERYPTAIQLIDEAGNITSTQKIRRPEAFVTNDANPYPYLMASLEENYTWSKGGQGAWTLVPRTLQETSAQAGSELRQELAQRLKDLLMDPMRYDMFQRDLARWTTRGIIQRKADDRCRQEAERNPAMYLVCNPWLTWGDAINVFGAPAMALKSQGGGRFALGFKGNTEQIAARIQEYLTEANVPFLYLAKGTAKDKARTLLSETDQLLDWKSSQLATVGRVNMTGWPLDREKHGEPLAVSILLTNSGVFQIEPAEQPDEALLRFMPYHLKDISGGGGR